MKVFAVAVVAALLVGCGGGDAGDDDGSDAAGDVGLDAETGSDAAIELDASADAEALDMGDPTVDGTAGDARVDDAAADVALDATVDAAGDMAADMGPDAMPSGCMPGVEIIDRDGMLPAAVVGHYAEALDCARDEGGAWFGGDFTRCLRKSDGSSARIWNTGCGWEAGHVVDGRWERAARTYTGQCDAMPWTQLGVEALNTGVLYDGFGAVIEGARFDRCPPEPEPCAPGVEVVGPEAPAPLAGSYSPAYDCARDEGGAWFGGVDYARCFRKTDGSSARIWNTGCGWEIGSQVDGRWARELRTYSGRCDDMPETQTDARALNTGLFFDGAGMTLTGVRAIHCDGPAPACGPPEAESRVEVSGGRDLPAGMVGAYVSALDCSRDEGGAWFGGVDYTRCFRRADRSSWRIWNTGCGWEIGQMASPGRGQPPRWARAARTYTGQCDAMPSTQLGTEALTAGVLYDGFGGVLPDARVVFCPGLPAECEPGATVSSTGDAVPAEMLGPYTEAIDCARGEAGAWFGVADYTRCFRKADGSGWRIWNTGCGWEIGESGPMGWDRYGRTYSGQCDAMPPTQLGVDALTTGLLYNPAGTPLADVRVDYCAE